jgi:hypothetical protein
MSDKQLLDWLEHEQACLTHANHKFIVEVHTERDPDNKDSLRKAIERRASRKDKRYD